MAGEICRPEPNAQSGKRAAENAAQCSVTLKVTRRAASRHGLGQVSGHAYRTWQKLLAMTDEIRAFLKEHDADLKAKPE